MIETIQMLVGLSGFELLAAIIYQLGLALLAICVLICKIWPGWLIFVLVMMLIEKRRQRRTNGDGNN